VPDNLSITSHDPAPPAPPTDEVGTTDLLGGILSDTRELIAAHADRLRRELQGDLKSFKQVLIAGVVAGLAVMVASILLAAAIAATLYVLGLPIWAAAWVVFVVAAAGAAVFVARSRATSMEDHLVDEIKAARDDVAWAGNSTVKAVADSPVEPPPPTQPLH
jgi:Flp pilus assembly protein TadB